MPPSPLIRRLLLSLTALLAFATIFAFAFVPISMSQDEWWHLKTGKWIYEHGMRPPVNDVFAYTSSDLLWDNPKPYRWDNHEWFSETLMYLVYRAGENTGFGPMRAVIAAKTLVWLIAFGLVAFFAKRRSQKWILALLFVVVAAAASRWTSQPRPPILTYAFIAFFHLALAAHRQGRIRFHHLLALPILMAGWANLHGGFLLGGIVVAAFFLGEVIECGWFKWKPGARDPERARASFVRGRSLFVIGILCGLFSLATPYGWRLYLLPFRVMEDKALVSLIWELQPPKLAAMWAYVGLFVFVGVAGLLNWRRIFIGEAVWIAFLLHQSLSHMRHMPLFAIAAAPLAAELAAVTWERFGKWRGLKERGNWIVEIFLIVATAGLSVWWLTHHPFGLPDRRPSYLERSVDLLKGRAYHIDEYPIRLADFIEDADFHGRMFNDSRYAGYLIWRFSPEKHQVFTDMRYDIFGGDFLVDDFAGRSGIVQFVDENDKIVDTRTWDEVYKEWDINFTVIDKITARESQVRPLIRDLEASNDWILVYQDPSPTGGLAIYLRNIPENQELLKRCRQLSPSTLYRRPTRADWGK